MKVLLFFSTYVFLFVASFSKITFNNHHHNHLKSILIFKAPKPATYDAAAIARKMCKYYSYVTTEYITGSGPLIEDPDILKPTVTCPNVDALIADGELAETKQFPHAAAIGYGAAWNTARWECSGNLISERYILSAAHCKESKNEAAKWARLGDTDLENPTYDGPKQQNFHIVETYSHSEYRPPDMYNDILLFRIFPAVTFSIYIRPICLPIPGVNNIMEGQKVTVAGFGLHDEIDHDLRLRYAKIEVFPPSLCKEYYTSKKNFSHGFDSTLSICAGDKNHTKDTCEGDSGGPLQINHQNESCMFTLLGITSTGPIKCGNPRIPAVYTNVLPYISWIQEFVWPRDTVV